MKCGCKGYYIKNYKSSQQNHAVKGISTLRGDNQAKTTRECLIKYFTFCYNSIYKVYKDTKYSTR